jgi:hypothetical protein
MMPLTDEIVDEIHAVRQQHAARFDFDIDRIIDDLRVGQEKHAAEGWPLRQAPDTPLVNPNAALQRSRFARR